MDILPVSVIIPTKNVEKTISACLDSIKKNNPAEIIVIDGNSADQTLEIARNYTTQIYSDEGKGTACAHQLGAEYATQEYIVYIDGDIIVPEGTLAALLAELRSSDSVCVSATMAGAHLTTYWERATDWNNRLHQKRMGGGLFAAVLRKDTVLKIKFDTGIKLAGDDVTFLMRLKKAGYKYTNSPVIVYHQHRADLKSLAGQRHHYGRSSAYLIKSYGPLHPGIWPPLLVLYWIGICVIKGKPQYIPYFFIDGYSQTTGMIKGFLEISAAAFHKTKH